MTAAAHIEATTINQRKAADPSHSAFVSANAGAGKTRVLTNRVARLLLEGVDPSTVLCITFTKAAAAEMADRLFKLLGAWALAEDATLQSALADLDGDKRRRSGDDLARARRLFARALETPGGLKIQTIHSFCESVLKRFPLEAGVAPGFSVVDDMEANELRRASIERVAGAAEGEVAGAFEQLLSRIPAQSLRALLEEMIGKRRMFIRAEEIGWRALGAEVAEALNISDAASSSIKSIIDLIGEFDLAGLKDLMMKGSATTRSAAVQIDQFHEAIGAQAKFDSINQVFLKADLGARMEVISKKIAAEEPAFAEAIKRLQAGILAMLDQKRAAEALDDTRALFTILEQCFAQYAARKAARAALDFDDLIAKTRSLFKSDGGASWVLYKLDRGLAHILLDEAQDTGPDAWDVIEPPLAEFFSGAGAVGSRRTFFAVGDQKQSIYSFQGADAALFKTKEADLAKTIRASHAFEIVPLQASFRTAAPVLAFVDALFRDPDVFDNVGDEAPLRHFCTREGAAGLVELWPLVPYTKAEAPNPWDAPLDAVSSESRERKLASEVAATIAEWLSSGAMLESQGRPIEPGDIMILVQSRGALFTEVIRALGALRVPVAGADKIALMDDQGVLDLVSYGRAALYEGDDLSLAETLKSPFFNVSEESLYDLAADRATPRLWRALETRRDERGEWCRAHDEICAARAVALNEGAAAFFTHVLESGAPSGWRRLADRLGLPSREPIEEFLRQAHEFELRHPRSLRLFLDAMQKSGAEVSREASEAGPTVRVMTAHKAKGLEANIVFLLDAHRHPPTSKLGDLVEIEGPHGDALPILAAGDAKKNAFIAAARDDAKGLMRDEYRRLLYVAATRARDRLYICGLQLGRGGDPRSKPMAERSWHALAEEAFLLLGDTVDDAGEKFGGKVRRLSAPQTVAPKSERSSGGRRLDVPVPDFLRRPAAKESRARRLSPSQLVAQGDGAPAYSPARGSDPYTRGRILHRLLELLPEVAPDARLRAADRLLAHHAATMSEGDRGLMRDEVLRVLADERFAPVFAPGSLAEVAIGGRPKGARSDVSLSGQIDRLVILKDRVLAVDYKTNRPPPIRVEDAPEGYIAQMAAYRGLLQEIYPGRKVETALLWTFDARLMAIPDEALDRALKLTLA